MIDDATIKLVAERERRTAMNDRELLMHEFLDRAHVMQVTFDSIITQHSCADEFKEQVSAVENALGNLYQAIGAKRFEIGKAMEG